MKEFQISLDYTEIDFLKTSLEVILKRQLNSIAEKNIYLNKNHKKLKILEEKIKTGKSNFFSNPKDDFDKLKEKQNQVFSKLVQNRNVNNCARKIYLSILDEKYKENPKQLETIKDLKRHSLEKDLDMPIKDLLEEWEDTFF
jgi:hypothetical protein